MLTSFHNFLAAISVARPWKETQFLPTQTADKKMLSLFPLEAKTIFAFMIHVKRMFSLPIGAFVIFLLLV